MGEVVPARTSADPTFPHPLALCCHYPVLKYCSASVVITSTVRVNTVIEFDLHSQNQKATLYESVYLGYNWMYWLWVYVWP